MEEEDVLRSNEGAERSDAALELRESADDAFFSLSAASCAASWSASDAPTCAPVPAAAATATMSASSSLSASPTTPQSEGVGAAL